MFATLFSGLIFAVNAVAATPKHGAVRLVARSTHARDSIYWGAVTGTQFGGEQAPFDMGVENDFVHTDADKHPSIVPWYAPFTDCSSAACVPSFFRSSTFNNVRRYGSIPMISWGSSVLNNTSLDQASISRPSLSYLASGAYDSYIRRWAEAAKRWGHPFFLRFDWEMNGNWFTWGVGQGGNTPAEFVAAWRHVHNIFTQVGATNATWVWCPNVGERAQMRALYPGSAYVNWTCVDAYNFGTVNGGAWASWNTIVHKTYTLITKKIAPNKPMMVAEFNSSPYGGSRANWLTRTLAEIPTKYPRIRAMVLYDTESFQIEGDSTTQTAFRRAIHNRVYSNRSYAGLNQSPIPVP